MILLHVYIPFAVMLLHTDFERLNNRPIFWVQKLLLSKWGLMQNLCCENEFYLHENKKIVFMSIACTYSV